MGSAMSAGLELVRLPGPQVVRAKKLTETGRAASALLSHFNRAIESLGYSSAGIAAEIGVDPSIVRDIRAGNRPLTAERFDSLPRRLRAEVARRILAQAEEELGTCGSPFADVARNCIHALGGAIMSIASAVGVSEPTREQLAEIGRALHGVWMCERSLLLAARKALP